MSNFSDLEVQAVNYAGYSILSLLCLYLDICEELIAIREIIGIDSTRPYIDQIRHSFEALTNIESALEEKWVLTQPPLHMVLLKYGEHKFSYNPKRFEERQYFHFLLTKKSRLEREFARTERVNRQRRRRISNTVIRRGCLRV